jgi:carbon-monoxide dehydrogenase large subunit
MRRVEDEKLITGRGRYAGDVKLTRPAALAVYRSAVPHGRITSLDLEAARGAPGVLAAWSAHDLPEEAGTMGDWMPRNMDQRPRPVLARHEVHYVGEAIAVVLAEEPYLAQDAVELVSAEVESLPGAGTVLDATAPGAARVHEDLESNATGGRSYTYGDIEAAFSNSPATVKGRFKAARICGGYMEPRAVAAEYDASDQSLTVWASTQAVFGVRDRICDLLRIPKEKVRVLAEDVGGGFGPKATVHPEEILVALAAWRLQRGVRWVAGRSEDTATTVQAHGTVIELELAADADGKLRGLRGHVLHDIGAYSASGTGQPDIIVQHMVSAYVLPAMDVEYQLVYTNAVPGAFVRGGGRPLGNYAIERMVDRLARELEMDPAELRRRNLVQPEQMPYDTQLPSGKGTVHYDGGDYPRLLEMALEEIDYDELRSRQAARETSPPGGRPAAGPVLGIGIACCVESSGFGKGEPARVRLEKDGSARLFVGSTPQGQGHLTMAAQVLSDRLGWAVEKVKVTAGDTSGVPHGEMTAGSRTAIQVGNATAKAGLAARRRLLERAAEVMEADPADLLLEDGSVSVRGTPARSVPVTEVIPTEGIEVLETFDPEMPLAYASGCHAAAVEVDPETGAVNVLRYAIIHDNGKAINSRLVEGQIQGGYVHGLGYALFEEAIYQADGNFVSASFLDYSIPGAPEAGEVPRIQHIETETPANPEGFKGAGESGTIPVPAAISNAVEDAISRLKPGAHVDEIPITPLRLFELLNNGQA